MTYFVCEVSGSDAPDVTGVDEGCPLSSALRALQLAHTGGAASLDELPIMVRKEVGSPFAPISAAARKKARKKLDIDIAKAKRDAERLESAFADAAARSAEEKQRLLDAAKIVLTLDTSLPEPASAKLGYLEPFRTKRVKVSGWVHNLRVQGKDMMFIVLRDGYGYLQCVLNGRLCHTFDALTLSTESTVEIYGTLLAVPDGKSVRSRTVLIWHFDMCT